MEQNLSVEAMHMTLAILRLLRPHCLEGVGKTRLGGLFDGGYIMLDHFASVTAAYSLGINDDVSWDLAIAGRGIPVYQYDHTIERLPCEHTLFHWERIGIAAIADPALNMATVPDLIAKLGHSDCRSLILKCDIENSEWEVLAGIPSRTLDQFQQIVIEMHDFDKLATMSFAQLVHRAVSKLLLTHSVVHVHGNNFARWGVVGGIPVPSVMEFSFARRDLGNFTVSNETFPTPLDMPCHSREADLYLGRFCFD